MGTISKPPQATATPESPSLKDSLPSKRVKLTGRAFYESIGSPTMILAPMVDQSEFVRFSFEYVPQYLD